MSEASTIGVCLKRLRHERALTQEQLAELAGVSVDLIGKLEQGRRSSARVTSLMKLANALDIDLSALVGRRDRIGADHDGGSILAVRDALLSPSLVPGLLGLDPDDAGEPTPLPELQAAVSAAWARYWQGEFGPLAAAIPGLIGEARMTHRTLGSAAAAALAQSYQLAACLLVHLGKTDLAAIGAERAITAAAEGDDEWQWATVVSTLAWVLMMQARLRESESPYVSQSRSSHPSPRLRRTSPPGATC
jgi:transcriptional regulator with XRE-family HTH domain